MASSPTAELQSRCEAAAVAAPPRRPRSCFRTPGTWPRREPSSRPGSPWSRPRSGGVAGALGYEDHEGAPADEMLAAAARIAHGVDVPVTVDAEAGYGMEPAELVAALRSTGAAGCRSLEDTDHTAGQPPRPGPAHGVSPGGESRRRRTTTTGS